MFPPAPEIAIAAWLASATNRLIAKPRTVLFPALMVRPETPAPTLVPVSSTIGALVQPGCVCASRTRGSVTGGSAEAGVIVATPPENMVG